LETEDNMALVRGVETELRTAKEKGLEIAPSLTQVLLDVRDKDGIALSDEDFSFVPASLFGAGSDTTASTMCSAVLAFVTHPSIMKVAHAELDSVVGMRMPTFEDEDQLPYIGALVKEVLRWRPVAVLGGTPHACTQDNVYQGWRIPAGTCVLGNSWAINLNEEYYPNPQLFNPARFLSEKDPRFLPELKGAKSHPAKTSHSSFGWGRRICPGAELATNSLFIALSRLIWAFDILPTATYDTFDYTDGFNIRPKSFHCQWKIRSKEHLAVLEREKKEADKEMEKFPAYE